MRKILEALDNESTVVHLDEYVTDTHEFVVPKSIPIIFDIFLSSLNL